MRLACVLLVLLGVLTWLGTLEQVHSSLYDVQRKYFESFFLLHDAGPVRIPLPGANLVMSLLALNLLLGGFVRMRKSRETIGILVTHTGIALLLVAALVKHHASVEGRVTLGEGESADYFESDFRWEFVVRERLPSGALREHAVPFDALESAREDDPVEIAAEGLPCVVLVREAHSNCRPGSSGDAGAVSLAPIPRDQEIARNIPGLRFTIEGTDGGAPRQGLAWGAQRSPFAALVHGEQLEFDLRRERHPLPFGLTLADFRKEDHPRSNMPRSFESDVLVDGERTVTISMNEPLRADGLVVYQASWGPQGAAPGTRLFSTFAVVRNPADSLPLVACIVIALGLMHHFTRKLARHVSLQRNAA
jgi:hypothetical protein